MPLITVTHTHQTSKAPRVTADRGIVTIQWGELRATVSSTEAQALADAISQVTRPN